MQAPTTAAFRRELVEEIERLRIFVGAERVGDSLMRISQRRHSSLIPSAIWGSTWLAITFQLGSVAPELSVAYRFSLAGMIARCVVRRQQAIARASPRREHLWLLGMGGTFFGLNYIGVYWAERYVASGLVAVVFSTIVFMSPIGMRVFFGERLTLRTLVAAALGVSGVALLFLPELIAAREGGSAALGIAITLVATVLRDVRQPDRDSQSPGWPSDSCPPPRGACSTAH